MRADSASLKIPTVGVEGRSLFDVSGIWCSLGFQSRWVGLSGLSLPVGQWGLQNIEDKMRGPVPTLMMPWQVASGSPTRLVPLMDMI